MSQQFVCQVSGPGLKSATVNNPTHVLVEMWDSSGRPCSLKQNITAQLELIPQATPPNQPLAGPVRPSKWQWSEKATDKCVSVTRTTISQYKVLYTAVNRGQHKLHVQVNNKEINGSPFTMTVYPDPTQLDRPVRVVTDLNRPYGIAWQ